ncbi:MAG: hypothetical protein AAGL23_00885 [Pseudomonadota bacterium]
MSFTLIHLKADRKHKWVKLLLATVLPSLVFLAAFVHSVGTGEQISRPWHLIAFGVILALSLLLNLLVLFGVSVYRHFKK